MENSATCGQGLAQHSGLPAKLSELVHALAETLRRHTKTLDVTDEHARAELGVYQDLAERLRKVAAELQAAAQEMAGQRDEPMGRHDEEALSDPALMVPFQRFVKCEEELLAMLQNDLARDRAMLAGE